MKYFLPVTFLSKEWACCPTAGHWLGFKAISRGKAVTLEPWLAQLASVYVSLNPCSAKLIVQSAAQQPLLMPA